MLSLKNELYKAQSGCKEKRPVIVNLDDDDLINKSNILCKSDIVNCKSLD